MEIDSKSHAFNKRGLTRCHQVITLFEDFYPQVFAKSLLFEVAATFVLQ